MKYGLVSHAASLGIFVFLPQRLDEMYDPVFLPVSRHSWEDKNPAEICLLPPQVMGKLGGRLLG